MKTGAMKNRDPKPSPSRDLHNQCKTMSLGFWDKMLRQDIPPLKLKEGGPRVGLGQSGGFPKLGVPFWGSPE